MFDRIIALGCYAGNAKRKRQEQFQSRKRQALDKIAQDPPTANAVTSAETALAVENGSPIFASANIQPDSFIKDNNSPAVEAVTGAAPKPAVGGNGSLSSAGINTQADPVTQGNNGPVVNSVTEAAPLPAVDGNGLPDFASSPTQPDLKHNHFAQMLLAAVQESSPGVIPSQLQQPSAESSHVAKLAGSIRQFLENGIPSTMIEAAEECVLGVSQHTSRENPAAREVQQSPALPQVQKCVVAKPVNDARGHTGYLTFARRSVDD